MRPEPMNEDELHDALVVHGFLTDDEARAWPTMLANLKQARRVVRLCIPCRSGDRSEEHTSELQSLMRISYAVFCLKKKNNTAKCIQTHVISKNNYQQKQYIVLR